MPDLPSVEQVWEADTAPYVAGLEAAIAAAREFEAANHEALASVAELQAGIDALHGDTIHINVDEHGLNAIHGILQTFEETDRAAADAAHAMDEYGRAVEGLRGDLAAADHAAADSGGTFHDLGAVMQDAGHGAAAAAQGLDDVAQAANRSKGPIASWWATWKNVVHWVVAGSAEFLAVAIPAMIALGAYALVASQGLTNMYNHLQSLYTVQEATGPMFHKTAGDILGIGHAIQSAQDKVNGQVYQLLGAYVDVASKHLANFAQMGMQVSGVVSTFTAKVALDMKGAFGSELTDLISGAVQDLVGLGQVLGNLGHIILNVAHSMPGIAAVLLHGLAGVTGMASRLTSIPFAQTMGMWMLAAEEFYRWGGVALGALTKLFHVQDYADAAGATGFIRQFGASFNALIHGAGNATIKLGTFANRAAEVSARVGNAGTKISEAGAKIAGFADKLSPLQGSLIGLATGAVALLTYKFVTAKSAAQEFAQSLQAALQAASNFQAPQMMASNIGKLSNAAHQAAQSSTGFSFSWENLLHTVTTGHDQFITAGNSVKQLQGAMQQTRGEEVQFAQGAAAIEKQFGVGYPQALAIADGANVKLSQSTLRFGHDMNIAGQQITDYMKGMRAMGAPTGAIGNDLKAVGIQAAETQTKVQQLNQAWDSFMQNLTGGTQGFSQLETALQGMSKDAAASSASLTGSISTIKRAAGGMSYSLKGDTATAMQSWQQFDQALSGSGTQLADWFRTAGSEGQMSSREFVRAIKDMTAQFIPLTQGNKTAVAELSGLAQMAGGPATSNLKVLEAWLGHTGNAGKNLQKIEQEVTQRMANMSKVAANLGDVLNNQVDSAISNSIMSQSGLNQKIQAYTNDLVNLGPHNQTTINALHQMQVAYNRASWAAQHASGAMKNFGNTAATAGNQSIEAARKIQSLKQWIDSLHSKNITIGVTQTISSQYLHGLAGTGHYASGTESAMRGVALVGERGPELVAFGGGERVYDSGETNRLLTGLVSRAGGGGGGMVGTPQHAVLTSNIHVHLDGHEIWRGQQRETLHYNIRNGGAQSGTWAPSR